MKSSYTLFMLMLFFIGFSQEKKIKEANAAFEKLGYMNAVSIYIEVDKNGYGSPDIYKKIADSYYFNANYSEANVWYEKLIKSTEDVDYEYYYRYSQTLKTVPDLEKSNYYYALFSRMKKADSRAQQFEAQSNYLSQIKTDSKRYTISNLEINSAFSDYGVFESKDGIIFTSARASKESKLDSWTKQPFSALYSSKANASNQFENSESFLKNTIFNSNESTAILTKDGLTLYFTRNNFKKNKQKKNNKDEVSLKIYSARFKNGQWTDVVELSFNSDNYNCAHPTLSPDEKTLYFSSNMPGTLGQSDLYRVAILADGKFGAPENLGATINTEGRETFPSISKDNKFSGIKIRQEPKAFYAEGTNDSQCDLFGQALFTQSTSKWIIYVEGELDALSAFQMLEAQRKSDFASIPVVSNLYSLFFPTPIPKIGLSKNILNSDSIKRDRKSVV